MILWHWRSLLQAISLFPLKVAYTSQDWTIKTQSAHWIGRHCWHKIFLSFFLLYLFFSLSFSHFGFHTIIPLWSNLLFYSILCAGVAYFCHLDPPLCSGSSQVLGIDQGKLTLTATLPVPLSSLSAASHSETVAHCFLTAGRGQCANQGSTQEAFDSCIYWCAKCVFFLTLTIWSLFSKIL